MNVSKKFITKALKDIVGDEWVSDDVAILEGYSKSAAILPDSALRKHRKEQHLPDWVVLPACTDEVQALLRLANRYRIPVMPMGTGFIFSAPLVPGVMVIDMKRMDKILEINVDDLTATVQANVSYAMLQAEAMRRGLWNGGCPLAGSQCKLAGQFNIAGYWQNMLVGGTLLRHTVSVTVVTPEGDIIKTGSPSLPGAGNIWWHGPGPDLTGLFRQSLGSFGIITEMVVKLKPWVGGESLPDDFQEPDHPPLPSNHRIYWIEYPDLDSEIRAVYEISRAGIGTHLNGVDTAYNCYYSQPSQERTEKLFREKFFPDWLIYVVITGISSKRQMDYEEKVLMEIIEETGGKLLSESYKPEVLKELEFWNLDAFRAALVARMMRRGGFLTDDLRLSRLEFIPLQYKSHLDAMKRHPEHPHITDLGTTFVYAVDRGHIGVNETDMYYNQADPKEIETALNLSLIHI